MEEGNETVQLPFIESGDASVQGGTVDPSINNEAASNEELTTAIDVEVTTSEPLAQSSEVQDQSPLEPLTQSKAGDNSNNAVTPELLVILDSSTTMGRTWAAVDEMT